jgi:hypothetical protein
MPTSAQLRPEHGQWKPRAFVARHKSFRRRKLQSDARQVLGSLRDRERLRTRAGIVDRDPLPAHGLEHHEMAHVPVQDCRQAELAQVSDLEPERSARQTHVNGDLDQRPQSRPIQRYRIPSSKGVEVDAVTVKRGHHRKAGQPALGRFGLSDERQVPATAEAQHDRGSHSNR